MKAAILTNEGFKIEERQTPECPAGMVLVKTAVCGICEGDIFRYKSVLKDGSAKELGGLIGHEGNGTVCKVGAGVKGIKVGDRVAALGGTYSEYFVADPKNLVKIPDGLSFEEALGEPVACYVHAANRFGIEKGDRVAILGCGFMGVGCLEMARNQGAGEIVAFDPIAWRREKALKLGASKALDSSAYSTATQLAELGEFDVVIEAAGIQSTIDMATAMVKQHGKIILIGYHQSNAGHRDIDMKTWNFKAIDVINGHVRRDGEKRDAMKKGLSLVAKGKLDMKSITASYKFSDISKAFKELVDRKEGLFKGALVFKS